MTERKLRPADEIPPAAAVEIGVARRDITPPVGIYNRNWGAARQDVANGVHRPLVATVMVIRERAGAPPLVLASLDAGWWQLADDEWRIRKAVLDALGIDRSRVMLCCSHTHAGSSICSADADRPGGQMVAPYLASVRDALVAAAQEALDRAEPATLTWATGRCDLAANRDLPDPDGGRVVCGYNPGGTPDDTLLVGRATDAVGRAIATIVNYACHATTLAWENRLLSPDYIGAMRELVEERTGGAPCLFLQGASGELAPREQYTGDTAIADSNGRRLGYTVLATLEAMLPPRTSLVFDGVVESGAPLAVWTRRPFDPPTDVVAECVDVELPLKTMLSESEIRRQIEACTDRTMAERLRRKLRVRQHVGDGKTCRMPTWIWRVGRSLFVGHPNEAYSAFQVALRRRFPDYAVAVMNVVNGSCGYMAPPEQYDRDIYQVWQSPFDRDSLPRLIEACEREISRMVS